jgi:hypothetical protein
MNTLAHLAQLRRLSAAELEQMGRESLREHLLAQAIVAHQKHGALPAEGIEAFLRDPECVRHPVRLVFEFGEMAMHQFAQPDIDWRNTAEDGRMLYLRPVLRNRPDLLRVAVAYMIPLINYGEIASDEHCLSYGAALLGLMEGEFYEKICALADFCGAEPRLTGEPFSHCAAMTP